MPAGTLRAFVNGAPGPLLERCTHLYTSTGIRLMTTPDRENTLAHTSAMATQALRVLGSAYHELPHGVPAELTADAVERDLVFVGLTGMYDPPRPEAKEAIARCHAAGIRVSKSLALRDSEAGLPGFRTSVGGSLDSVSRLRASVD